MTFKWLWDNFNPRLREGGDGSTGGKDRRNGAISIHASAREATSSTSTSLSLKVFQSTPPRGRRHVSPLLSHLGNGHFNPRLREGGDVKEGQILLIIDISIHASAREATGLIIKKYVNDYISIHASAREATALFQDSLPLTEISIHASAREATAHFPVVPSCLQLISIHASAREATIV